MRKKREHGFYNKYCIHNKCITNTAIKPPQPILIFMCITNIVAAICEMMNVLLRQTTCPYICRYLAQIFSNLIFWWQTGEVFNMVSKISFICNVDKSYMPTREEDDCYRTMGWPSSLTDANNNKITTCGWYIQWREHESLKPQTR